jgi:outer membrane protein
VAAAQSAYAPTLSLLGEASVLPGQQTKKFATDPTNRDSPVYDVAILTPIGSGGDALKPRPRYGMTADIRGTLYDFGRTSAAVAAATAQRRAAEADARKTGQDLVRDVRAAYLRWATNYALWQISERAAHASEDRKKLVEASIQEGARRTADLTASISEAGFARLELQHASAEVAAAREELAFLAAHDLAASAVPADDVLQMNEHATDDSAAHEDSALIVLDQQRAAAKATARVHDKAFVPLLSANAQAGVQGAFGSVFPLYRLQVNLSVPLWDGGADRALRAQSEARAAQLAAQTRAYTEQRDYLRRRALAAQTRASERIVIALELEQACNARLAQLEEARPLGAATASDVKDARGALQRAEVELVLARAARAQALLGVVE